jgi:hypothetical protein
VALAPSAGASPAPERPTSVRQLGQKSQTPCSGADQASSGVIHSGPSGGR